MPERRAPGGEVERILKKVPTREIFQGEGMKRRVRVRSPGAGEQYGFSLLEVVITIALLSSVALGVAILLVPVARQSRIQRETEIANIAAKKVLEKVQATPFHQIVTAYPNGSIHPIPELPAGRIVVTYADPAADPLFLRADLSWNSREVGPMSRRFETVRTE